MGQALYRKHRPKQLSEVVGQEHITQTLSQAVRQGRISHAYLFTGPRGVGKTSVARILAHQINDLAYEDDNGHIDIIEIDAASNRRIDEIRELRDKVYVAPVSAKYKVYIIDEVHMLTREAFNALLKTLEEPPAHAVFILATTDAHKLPDTIISRTQRFSFRPVDKGQVTGQLKAIAGEEKIKISDAALELLAEYGEGSFRDSISLLDQAGAHGGQIEVADVQRLLGLPPARLIDELERLVFLSNDTAALMTALNELYSQGYRAPVIAKRLAGVLRLGLLSGELPQVPAINLMSRLIEVPAAHDSERFLELTLIRANLDKPTPAQPDLAAAPPAKTIRTEPKAKSPKPPTEPKPTTEESPKSKPESPAPVKNDLIQTKPLDENAWPEVLKVLKQRYNTLYGVVRMAQPDFSEAGSLKLTCAFAFHQKRLDEAGNRQKLSDIIKELTGTTVVIECLLDKTAAVEVPQAAAEATLAADQPDLAAISNIFGEAELLES